MKRHLLGDLMVSAKECNHGAAGRLSKGRKIFGLQHVRGQLEFELVGAAGVTELGGEKWYQREYPSSGSMALLIRNQARVR